MAGNARWREVGNIAPGELREEKPFANEKSYWKPAKSKCFMRGRAWEADRCRGALGVKREAGSPNPGACLF